MKLKVHAINSIFIAIFIITSGCDMIDQSSKSSNNDFNIDLDINPTHINHDGEITAIYSIRNNTSQTVEMVSGCTQLARGIVFKDDQVIGLNGSADGCFTAISTHEIAAGENLEFEWQIKPFSVRFYPDDREPDTTFADSGKYVFTVKPDVFEVNKEQKRLPELERTFVIE
ncbi:MAG: hypothetical protein WEA58_02180 [Balneolaceae bacterium]